MSNKEEFYEQAFEDTVLKLESLYRHVYLCQTMEGELQFLELEQVRGQIHTLIREIERTVVSPQVYE